jgi:hypothetical protein
MSDPFYHFLITLTRTIFYFSLLLKKGSGVNKVSDFVQYAIHNKKFNVGEYIINHDIKNEFQYLIAARYCQHSTPLPQHQLIISFASLLHSGSHTEKNNSDSLKSILAKILTFSYRQRCKYCKPV